jgi:formyltetrahydrofolate-dependent phosphoribosylglycinamide formyltransferase
LYDNQNQLHFNKVLLHICSMLQKLQRKWKVNGTSLLLILITFALGGSACGIVGRKLMAFTGIEKSLLWGLVYIIVLTIIWPLCVLVISIPMGQFAFFKKYIGKLVRRFGGRSQSATNENKPPTRVAIFASGNGSNAASLIQYFKKDPEVEIALVVCNKPVAGVLQVAADAGIETLVIEKERFYNGDAYLPALNALQINWIVLAGFLWKLPPVLIQQWPSAIFNIHPALLPKFGGKGMYGAKVHQAVIDAQETESGISIHFVDEQYDHGAVIFQAPCVVLPDDTHQTLANRIQELEHRHFPEQIARIIKSEKLVK